MHIEDQNKTFLILKQTKWNNRRNYCNRNTPEDWTEAKQLIKYGYVQRISEGRLTKEKAISREVRKKVRLTYR